MREPIPVQLIVAAFPGEDGAAEAWKQLKKARWGELIAIDRIAIVRRTTGDKVKIKEPGDPGGGQGAVVGAVVGGIIGSIAGPLGAVVVGGAAGALVGGITARYYDSGIPQTRLENIGAALIPGTSAIVAIIEHDWVKELEEDMQKAGATVMTDRLSTDIARQLDADREMAFTAIGGEEGMAITHVAADTHKSSAYTAGKGTAVGASEEHIAVLEMVTDRAITMGASVITVGDNGDEETEGAGVITGGDEKTEGAGVITGGDEKTEGAGVITGGDEKTEGAGVITGGDGP